MVCKLILKLLLVCGAVLARVDYSGYQLLKFHIETQEQLDFLSNFRSNQQFIYDGDHPFLVGRTATIGVPPAYVDLVTDKSVDMNMAVDVIYPDLQAIIDLQLSTAGKKSNLDDFNFDTFNRYDDILDQLDVWAANCPAGLECTLTTYGTTYEGRELKHIKIGVPGGNTRAYWMHGVTHAREWLGVATVLKIMDRMWTGYGEDDVVTGLLNDYDWYFAPMTNPDGYEYTFTNDRMWRKNRSPSEGSNCHGTDINRNYDVVWGTEGVSHNPCDYQVYCGSEPASELETQAIQSEVARVGSEQTLLAFIDVHTYGEMILMPFSYSIDHAGQECAQAPNHDDLMQVSNAFADAIQFTHNEETWIRGSPCEILYTVSGGSHDWAIDSGSSIYGFTPELRGPGFVVDEDQIQPSYEEFWNGVVAMVEEIRLIEGF